MQPLRACLSIRETATRAFEPEIARVRRAARRGLVGARRRGLDAALRRALSDGELRLDFQPLVAVAGGATTGFEALLRWRRPGFGELAAGRFVAAAEGSPAFDDVGAWALLEAARAAAAWPSSAAGRSQPFSGAIAVAEAGRDCPQHSRSRPPRPTPPRARNRPIRPHRRLRRRRLDPQHAAQLRRHCRARRFRRRRLVDAGAGPAAARSTQDRPHLHRRGDGQSALRGGDPRGGANRQGTRVGVDRRRGRDLRAIRTVALGRLRRDPGLFPQPAAAGKRTRRRVRAQPGRLRRPQRLPPLFALRPTR